MEEIARIMARGFWPRLMGYISAARTPNPDRVLELIAKGPTGIRTDYHVAAKILQLGQQARKAAKSWKANEPIWEALLPKVPTPGTPNIDGGREGLYEVGLIVRGGDTPTPRAQTDKSMIFSTDRLLTFQETVERLVSFALFEGNATPGLVDLANKAVDNWTLGRGDFILPQWFYERYIVE